MKFQSFMKTRSPQQQTWSDSFYKWLRDNDKNINNRNQNFWIDAWNDYCDSRNEGLEQPLNLTPERRI